MQFPAAYYRRKCRHPGVAAQRERSMQKSWACVAVVESARLLNQEQLLLSLRAVRQVTSVTIERPRRTCRF